jgi:glutamate transport system permease protein
MAMTPTEAALFEAAGPHARRRILVGTVVTSLLFAALVVWLIMRLDANGQFDPMYWDLFANINIWKFLGAGFIGTARASLSSGAIALVGGLVLMFGRISGIAPVRWLATAVIEFVRGTPTLLFIYFFFLVPSQFGIHMSTYWMVVIPVSFYASAVLAEVYRAGVQAVPAGQSEKPPYRWAWAAGRAYRLSFCRRCSASLCRRWSRSWSSWSRTPPSATSSPTPR